MWDSLGEQQHSLILFYLPKWFGQCCSRREDDNSLNVSSLTRSRCMEKSPERPARRCGSRRNSHLVPWRQWGEKKKINQKKHSSYEFMSITVWRWHSARTLTGSITFKCFGLSKKQFLLQRRSCWECENKTWFSHDCLISEGMLSKPTRPPSAK